MKDDSFEMWLADMDDALDRFIQSVDPGTARLLDYSPSSLAPLEKWILERYSTPDAMLAPPESRTIDGIARYVGETIRKEIGGRWEMRMDDPKYAYYGLPQLTGFWDKPTPLCPATMATALVDRRTGTFLANVLASYQKQKLAKQKSPKG